MSEVIQAKTPAHLWVVGGLATLWNAFGCYDYFMTQTQGAAYIKSMMPTVDTAAMMQYLDSFPVWAEGAWALGVWGGLAGSLLLLLRKSSAVWALGASLIGAIVGIGYQLANPSNIAQMHEGAGGVMPYVIILVAALLFFYSRAMKGRGVFA